MGLGHLISLCTLAPLNSHAYAHKLAAKSQLRIIFFFFFLQQLFFGMQDYTGAITIQIVPDLLTARH